MNSTILPGSCAFTTSAGVFKPRQEGREVTFEPPPPDFAEDLLAILLHFGYESAGCARLFMPRAPNQQLKQDRRQINPFLRQPVLHFSSICFRRFRVNNGGRFKFLKTVRQDVRGNAFARFLEFLKRAESANHQIANNQQRPAIAELLERDTDRAAGPAFSHNRYYLDRLQNASNF